MNCSDIYNIVLHYLDILLHYVFRVPLRFLFKRVPPKTKEPLPLIKTKLGAVFGRTQQTTNKRLISSFCGIPYAIPPVGKLRFCRSSPAEPWEGVLDGTKEPPECIQVSPFAPTFLSPGGSEDCLYLNVYTQKEGTKLPVVVFIHGGGFLILSANYEIFGPQILLDRDIVLVVMNYRLGILGFLSVENDSAPGNLGLHDQYLALLWVKENISQFGGDPENITLMGHSAGSMSAMLHLISPFSQGLFHKVIALSGSLSNPYMQNSKHPLVYARALASKFGCPEDANQDQILRFLRRQSAEDIVLQTAMFKDWDYAIPIPWLPIIDTFASKPFLPINFPDALNDGHLTKVPIIMGCSKDDGTIFSGPFYRCPCRWKLLSSQWNTWAPIVFLNRERDETTEADLEVIEEIKEFYFGGDVSSLYYNNDVLTKLEQIFSSSYYHEPWDKDAHVLAQTGYSVHIFMLTLSTSFSFADSWRIRPFLSVPLTLFKLTMKRLFGLNLLPNVVGHTEIVSLLFPNLICVKTCTPFSPEEDKIRNILLDIIESYAKTGIPVARDLEDGVWKPVDGKKGKFLEVGKKIIMANDKELDKHIKFWMNVKKKVPMKLKDAALLSNKPANTYEDIAINR